MSGPITNGVSSLAGEFWAPLTLVEKSVPPLLAIFLNPQLSTAPLSLMPPTPGFTLQSTASLSPTNWVNAPSGTNNPATIPAALPARFYRLFKP